MPVLQYAALAMSSHRMFLLHMVQMTLRRTNTSWNDQAEYDSKLYFKNWKKTKKKEKKRNTQEVDIKQNETSY